MAKAFCQETAALQTNAYACQEPPSTERKCPDRSAAICFGSAARRSRHRARRLPALTQIAPLAIGAPSWPRSFTGLGQPEYERLHELRLRPSSERSPSSSSSSSSPRNWLARLATISSCMLKRSARGLSKRSAHKRAPRRRATRYSPVLPAPSRPTPSPSALRHHSLQRRSVCSSWWC